MERRKVWDKGREKRSGSHAVVPKGYALVKTNDEPAADKGRGKDRNDDRASKVLGGLLGASFRHRAQLLPAAGAGVVVWAAATSPAAAATTLMLVSVVAHLLATDSPIKGHRWVVKLREQSRKWLSLRERSVVGRFAAFACVWSVLVMAGYLHVDRWGVPILLGALAWPAAQWIKGREVRKPQTLSKRAKQYLAIWRETVALNEGPLYGSHVLPSSVEEPGGDTLTFVVETRGVHAEKAATSEVRQYLEVTYPKLGPGMVQLEKDRDSAKRLRVTITPDRHLEQVEAVWDGPVVNRDGSIELAVTDAGKPIRIHTFSRTGVDPFGIVGTSDAGKSNTAATVILPGVLSGIEVFFYADGGRGSSAAHLKKACDWRTRTPEGWEAMIRATHSVLVARELRRGEEDVDTWRGLKESDPILTLLLEEAPTIKRNISARAAGMVMEIHQRGRKHGVRAGQIAQGATAQNWIGEQDAKELMAGTGAWIVHRVASNSAVTSASTSVVDAMDTRGLPEEPGFVAVARRNQVLAQKARVRYARPEVVNELLQDFTPRALSGQDLMAAGQDYRNRVDGKLAADASAEVTAHPEATASVQTPTERLRSGSQRMAATGAEVVRARAKHALRGYPNGLNTSDLAREVGVSWSGTDRAMQLLLKAGEVTRDDKKLWKLIAEKGLVAM